MIDLTNPEWRMKSLCHSHADPEIWFPTREVEYEQRRKRTIEARRICHECPVFYNCRQYALSLLESGVQICGIWASVNVGTEGGRRQLATVKQKPAPKTIEELAPYARKRARTTRDLRTKRSLSA